MIRDFLLLETGDYLLLETGDKLIIRETLFTGTQLLNNAVFVDFRDKRAVVTRDPRSTLVGFLDRRTVAPFRDKRVFVKRRDKRTEGH